MFGINWLIGIVVAVNLSSVTGIAFTLSRNQIELGNPIDTYWTMNCSMTASNVNSVLFIKILRESMNADEPWQVIASVTAQGTSLGSLPNDLNDNNVDADGIVDSTTPTNSKLGVSMTSASLSCDDERKYRCELSYLLPSLQTMEQALNATLTVSAPASVPVLSDVENYDGSASNPKVVAVGVLLQLQCEANIGTDSSRTISWRKSSETSNALIGYNSNVGDGTAVVDNSDGTANSCKYKRTSTMMYNTTINDANRDDQYPLRFSCYVGSTSAEDPLFYVDVSSGSGGNSYESVDNAGSSNAGTIAGSIVGGLALIVIVALLVYFLWYRRRSTGNDYKTKEEYGSENPNMAPQTDLYAVPDKSKSRRGHENKGLDEPHESRPRYGDEYNGRGGRANYGMHKDDDDYDRADYNSEDGSPTLNNDRINHMGADISIGTGV